MSKMKRAVAIALAAAMTMGSTLTVSAADTTGSGETHGSGENEGHVEKEVINVVLPTMPEEGSPFDYVTDPERLIKATAGARYEDYTFPEADSDTGVYFRVGEKEFSNTSKTLQVINKSSCDVTVTVTAGVTAAGDKDLKLATSSTTSADNPLYLNLKVGTTDTTIAETGTPVPKTIAGSPSNFEVQYTADGYQYVTKEDAAYWQALNFSLNGAVFEGVVEADTTAPTVDVTWAFAKAATGTSVDTADQVQYEETAEPAILSISEFIKADPKNVVVKFSLGKGPDAVDADGVTMAYGADKTAIAATRFTLDMANKTVTIDGASSFLSKATADLPVYITLTKGGAKVKELKGTITVKEDYSAEPEIISITDYSPASQNNVVITFSLGVGAQAVEADGVKLAYGADKASVADSRLTVDMPNNTVTIDGTSGFLTKATTDLPVYVTLTKGDQEVKELAGTIKVK